MATQLDFATRQLANPSAGVQQSLSDLGAMFGHFQKNKIDAEAVAEQRAQRAIENKRADAMLNIQQRQADQQAEKFGIDKATIAGTQIASQQLQGATQGLITPDQAIVIQKAYDANLAKNKGTNVEGMMKKAQAAYEASPMMQRQYLSGVNIAQTPTMMQVGVDELGQPKMVEVQGDAAKAQDLKTQMLRDYDTKIQQDKLFGENQRQFGLRQALDEAQFGETKKHNRMTENETKLARASTAKDSEYFKAYARGKGTKDAQWESMTPAERAKDKDARVASKLAMLQNKAGIMGNLFTTDSSQYALALKAVEDEDKALAATELKILEAARKK